MIHIGQCRNTMCPFKELIRDLKNGTDPTADSNIRNHIAYI